MKSYLKVFVCVLLCVSVVFSVGIPVKAYKYKPTKLNKQDGVFWYDDGNGLHKETYYNLDMKKVVEKAKSKGIKGPYWETKDGLKMYGYYIILAANYDTHPYGSVVETSLGFGKVLDTGAFAQDNPTQIDLAVTW